MTSRQVAAAQSLATAGIVALALVALTGCSGAPMPTPTAATAPPLATAAPAAGSSLQPAPAATGTPVDASAYATLLPAPDAGIDVDSTDRNIACSILDPSSVGNAVPWAACSIAQKDFLFPAGMTKDPAASALVVSGTRAGTVFEVGDFVFPGAAQATADRVGTLAADRSITYSTVTCQAIGNGIRCTNTATGHGFFLSRVEYEVF